MERVLVLSGVLKKRIWGGNYFRDILKITSENELYGEFWTLSAHSHGQSQVINGIHEGKDLSEVYSNHRELFDNCPSAKFPVLIKIIDAADDLSVQVHPDDDYAQKHENEYGKTEFWYIMDCKPKCKLILGHTANTKEELVHLIKEGKFKKLLKERTIKKGESFFIKAGTIHALRKGTIVLEIQQSSDVTYRVYDYERVDKDGNKRELHIEKAIDVIEIEDQFINESYNEFKLPDVSIKKLTDNSYFKTYLYNINSKYLIENPAHNFYFGTVIRGEPLIDGIRVTTGQSFIITSLANEVLVNGNSKIIISTLSN